MPLRERKCKKINKEGNKNKKRVEDTVRGLRGKGEYKGPLGIFWPGQEAPAGTSCVLMCVFLCMCA